MKDETLYSEVPKPPKAIGISRRLLFALAGIVLLIVTLFLIFLNHYAPHPIKKVQPIENNNDSLENTVTLINKIQNQTHQSILVDVKKNRERKLKSLLNDNKLSTDSTLAPLTENDFKEASNASISVYHDNVQKIESNDAALPYSNTSNSLQNIRSEVNAPDTYSQQNLQSEKIAFLKTNDSLKKNTIQSQLQHTLSPYQINAGTIIPANIMTGINSELPGNIIAKVRRNVYDTATGDYLLIPQGTTLIGTYDSQIAYGQSRVLIVWSRLIFPNASSFDLEGMPGADLSGLTGLHDEVNNHYIRVFSSALMFSLFNAAGQMNLPQNNTSQPSLQQIISGAIGQQMGQTATQLIAKNMNIQPTLNIRPGVDFNVLLTRDMVLQKPYPI